MSFPAVSRSVLITGCSSGIGLASARMLKARGWTVYPTARNPEDLQKLIDLGFDAIEMDVASSESIQSGLAQLAERTNGVLGALVNNAGFGQAGAVEDLSRDAMRYQFEVNVFGVQELILRTLPMFRAHYAGRIVNVSSVVGRIALPFLGAYSSSKFAIEALSDALRVELDGTGIAVSIIEPGPIITDFRENTLEKMQDYSDPASSRFGDLFKREMTHRRDHVKKAGFINKPPEAVAKKMVHALESPSPRRRYCVTLPAYAGAALRRFAPDAFVDYVFKTRLRKKCRPV
ncbi:MAG: SDR family NAD(P)-dependent oxidoreductase [Verrucomicrobia bacterium]|nr:SDR family NAD(P)-dependent oxidoreductase [Verrucomicrobiota bacterium]